MQRRRRKRYGPVHKRGVCKRVLEQIQEAEDKRQRKELTYLIPAGTRCHVKKMSEKGWREYVTKKAIRCTGFVWRNQTHYGFAYIDYDIKVRVGDFTPQKGEA